MAGCRLTTWGPVSAAVGMGPVTRDHRWGLDMAGRGCLGSPVRTAETSRNYETVRKPYGRLLPGDGVGVGCVSPLHANTGRFQAMTMGR